MLVVAQRCCVHLLARKMCASHKLGAAVRLLACWTPRSRRQLLWLFVCLTALACVGILSPWISIEFRTERQRGARRGTWAHSNASLLQGFQGLQQRGARRGTWAHSNASLLQGFQGLQFHKVLDCAAHRYGRGRRVVAITVVADVFPESDPGAEAHSLALLHNQVYTWVHRLGVSYLVAVTGSGGCSSALRTAPVAFQCFELPPSSTLTRASVMLEVLQRAVLLGFDVIMLDADVIALGNVNPLFQLLSMRQNREDALLPVSEDCRCCIWGASDYVLPP